MKKILATIFATVVLFSLTGCEKFLTELPKSSLVAENAFTTESDWEKTLTGAYAMLQNVFMQKYTIVLNEFGTDEVEPFDLSWALYVQMKYYTFDAQHEFLRCHYIWAYDGIKRCNTVLDMPASAPVSPEKRALMEAQAKFLRAIFYFDLVTYYGGVPIWTTSAIDPDQISKPRESVDAVYKLIFEDMEAAALGLPEKWTENSDIGRATSSAAYAFLGRFYLQYHDYAKALAALEKIEGKFSLYNNLNDIFSPKHKNEFKENIFEIQFSHSGNWGLEGSLQSSYWGPRGGGGPTNNAFGWGGFGPTQYLYDQYEAGDKRRSDWFCTEYRGVPQNPPCTMKFRDPDYGDQIEDDDLNYVMMRYADVLLMMAEALNETGDSSNKKYDCINAVRRRAGVGDLSGLSQEAFRTAVLKERLLELNCEHHRRTDLIRFGKLLEQVHAAFPDITLDDHCNLYPIPQQAIDSNNAMSQADQNPGY